MIHLTLYRGARAPVPIDQADFADWAEVVEAVRDVVQTESKSKVDMLAIGPHRLKVPYRKNENVKEVTLLALDVDRVPDLDALLDASEEHAPVLIYESPSSTEDEPRVRVLAPTDRTMTREEAYPARQRFAEALGLGPDCGVRECQDPARIFFAGRLEGSPPRRVWEY